MKLLPLLLLLLFVVVAANNRFYMRTAKLQDQATAASGYLFKSDSQGPTSYVHFNNFGHHPWPYVAHSQFTNHGGNSAEKEQHSSKGEKGELGHKSFQKHQEAAEGHHDNKDEKGEYSEKGGHAKAQGESEGHYQAKHDESKGSGGEHFEESKSHKKGSKTTGFHKVYHKDEYKKEHTFYDESDARGRYEKHGDHEAKHSSEKGGHVKGGKSDSRYHQGDFAKKGQYDKGRHSSKESEFKGDAGEQEYHSNHADYSKKDEKEGSNSFGYDEEDD